MPYPLIDVTVDEAMQTHSEAERNEIREEAKDKISYLIQVLERKQISLRAVPDDLLDRALKSLRKPWERKGELNGLDKRFTFKNKKAVVSMIFATAKNYILQERRAFFQQQGRHSTPLEKLVEGDHPATKDADTQSPLELLELAEEPQEPATPVMQLMASALSEINKRKSRNVDRAIKLIQLVCEPPIETDGVPAPNKYLRDRFYDGKFYADNDIVEEFELDVGKLAEDMQLSEFVIYKLLIWLGDELAAMTTANNDFAYLVDRARRFQNRRALRRKLRLLRKAGQRPPSNPTPQAHLLTEGGSK